MLIKSEKKSIQMALKVEMLRSVTLFTIPVIVKSKIQNNDILRLNLIIFIIIIHKTLDSYVYWLFGMPECNKYEENGISIFNFSSVSWQYSFIYI